MRPVRRDHEHELVLLLPRVEQQHRDGVSQLLAEAYYIYTGMYIYIRIYDLQHFFFNGNVLL